MGRSPAEKIFAGKIKSVFDKLIPQQAKFKKTVSPHKKHFFPGDKVIFKAYKNNMTFWEVGTIKQRIVELVYTVQGPKTTNKRHMNQLRKCRLNESEESPQNTCEEPIDAIFNHFELDAPKVSPEVQRSGRKKNYVTTRRKSQDAEVLITLVYKKKILVWGKNGDKCFLLIWVCWIQIYKLFCSITSSFLAFKVSF